MHGTRCLGVIPARIGSERLPRKPLLPVAGRPLIEWVWRAVAAIPDLDAVVIATDSEEVVEAARRFGGEAVLTSADHASGTDRVAELVARPEYRDFDIVVNVQGDEPLVEAAHVVAAAALVREGWDVGTVATPIRSLEAWRDPAVVKVVRGRDGGALYFSRAPIPYRRDGEPTAAELASPAYLRHVGIYAYSRDALARWVALPAGELEQIERLEQLRPLAAGLRIGVTIVESAHGGVDTPADIPRVERQLRAMANPSRART